MRISFCCLIAWFLTFFLFLVASSTALAGIDKSHIAEKVKTAAVPFVANHGQFADEVSYYAKTLSGTLFVTNKGELVYNLPKIEVTGSKHDEEKQEVEYSGGVILREKLVNARVDKVTADQEAVARINYFKGNDPSKWQRGITTYEEVSLGEVYNGIELKLKAYGNNVEKLFYVSAGADPAAIRLALSGADKIEVLDSGELQASTRLGDVSFTKPVAWQEKNGKQVPVQVAYDIISSGNDQVYAFQVGSYDKSSILFIDPLLASTYLGGTGEDLDVALSITIDSTGNVFVTGYSTSTDYPTNPSATGYDESHNGGYDIVISKLSNDLSTLHASTYLGGTGEDRASYITLDSTGNVFVTGSSDSTDYPTNPSATEYDESYNGGSSDIVISKLSDVRSVARMGKSWNAVRPPYPTS